MIRGWWKLYAGTIQSIGLLDCWRALCVRSPRHLSCNFSFKFEVLHRAQQEGSLKGTSTTFGWMEIDPWYCHHSINYYPETLENYHSRYFVASVVLLLLNCGQPVFVSLVWISFHTQIPYLWLLTLNAEHSEVSEWWTLSNKRKNYIVWNTESKLGHWKILK